MDRFLEYFALGVILLSVTVIFYLFIYIHDIPHRIAKKRNHPQAEAIHYACWVSLFTLHAIWPFVFIWAVSKAGPLAPGDAADTGATDRIAALEARIARLETTVRKGSDHV